MIRVRPGGDGRGFAAEADVALSLIAANRGSKMKFAVITLPYSVDTHKGAAAGPDALLQAGLADWVREEGQDVVWPVHVKLTPGEEAAYGAWNKIGFANDRPHPALGQDLTPSPTRGRGRAGSGVRAGSARIGARVDSSRPYVALPCAWIVATGATAQPCSCRARDRLCWWCRH